MLRGIGDDEMPDYSVKNVVVIGCGNVVMDVARSYVRKANVEEKQIPCDLIVVAIGQGIESKPFEDFGIPVKWGAIDALNSNEIKDVKGIFAGGDCVTGPATVIRAIAAGKVAAANIDEYLGLHHEIDPFPA